MLNHKRRLFLFVWVSFLFLAVGTQFSGTARKPKEKAGAASDRVIVKFKKGAFKNLGLKKIKHFRLIDAYVYKVPAGETAVGLIKRLSLEPGVKYAEPDFIQSVFSTIPNDALFGQLWGLRNTGQTGGTPGADISATEAWDSGTGTSGGVVAVIDSGVDDSHPDLVDNMWTNPGETPGDGIDNDGNGYIDDVHGINAITGSGDPMDDNDHGTHCSGTIGAKGNNSIGVAGVCWTVNIMALKFINIDGYGYDTDAIECIEYAITKGAHVLSNSWGGGGYSLALKDAIEAAKNAGILFIAAAGNSGTNNDATPTYPASYDNENIIAVAATDRNDQLAEFSCYGTTTVDVAAPGVSITSCVPGGGYQSWSGTSMATPHVAGLAALLKSYNPAWTWSEIRARILAGTDSLAGLNGFILTGGRVNAFNSLFSDVTLPHIFWMEPPVAIVGGNVKIIGYAFGNLQGTGTVEFGGGVQAAITSWTESEIDCAVPDGAQTGDVHVTDTNGNTSNGFSFQVATPYYNESLISNEYIGGGTALNLRTDDGIYNYALPFAFNFFGTTHPVGSIIRICSNGYIDFVNTNADFFNSTQELKANVRIAPLWMDLITNGLAQAEEDVYVTPTSNSLTIRWCAETYYYEEPLNFEVVLSANGPIKFNYGPGNLSFHSYWTPGPTIGISCGQCNYYYNVSQYDNITDLSMVQTDLFTPVNTSTIEVTSPNASSVWLKKSAQQIMWTKSGDQDANIKIQLWRNGKKTKDIATSTANDVSYDWTVPRDVTAAANYFVRIVTLDTFVSDDSDLFTIVGPKITLTAPDAASIWQRGTTETILWTKLGAQGTKVNIELWRDNNKIKDIALDTANDGSYDWKIQTALKARSGYVVRVETTDGKVRGESAPFTISAPTLTVTSPTISSTWARGSNQTIAWTTTGVQNAYVTIQLRRGANKINDISTKTDNDGSYDWVVPSVADDSNYFIRIKTLDGAVKDDSDRFVID